MLVRIFWARKSSPVSWHTYQCNDYFVEVTKYSETVTANSKASPTNARIMLDGGKHDILVSDGDVVYFMNDNGKTVDFLDTGSV